MQNSTCTTCRRAGTKLFLKGEKCFSPKCPVLRKPYAPGAKGKRRKAGLSEFGKELREKQKLKNWYNLRERQFKNYVKEILGKQSKTESAENLLIKKLESRLDNLIFRFGLAPSRSAARQMVSHGHFLVNGKSTNIPSYLVKKGDRIQVKKSALQKVVFRKAVENLKKYKQPSWLKLDSESMEGEVVGEPNIDEAAPPAEISVIFEFYSR